MIFFFFFWKNELCMIYLGTTIYLFLFMILKLFEVVDERAVKRYGELWIHEELNNKGLRNYELSGYKWDCCDKLISTSTYLVTYLSFTTKLSSTLTHTMCVHHCTYVLFLFWLVNQFTLKKLVRFLEVFKYLSNMIEIYDIFKVFFRIMC